MLAGVTGRAAWGRDHQEERPEHQGQDPQDAGLVDGETLGGVEGLAKGVERAGTDVAEHDAEGAQRGDQEIARSSSSGLAQTVAYWC